VKRDEDGRIVGAESEDEDCDQGQDETQAAVESALRRPGSPGVRRGW
jgi:hypothetical protein